MRWLGWGAIGLVAACAPSVEDSLETDELSDLNFELSSLKDAHHDDRSLELIDEMLTDGIGGLPALVEDPSTGGCAVGVMLGDRVHYLESHGTEAGSTDLSLDSVFAVASVSKTVTALAAWDYGLDGDDTIGDLTAATGSVEPYTIRQLRLMQVSAAGTFGPTEYGTASISSFNKTLPRLALLAWDDHTSMSVNPKYSNANYAALGGALDQELSTDTSLPAYERSYEGYTFSLFNEDVSHAHSLLTMSLLHERRYDNGEYDHLAVGHMVDGTVHNAWEVSGEDYGPYGGWSMTIGDLTRLIVHLQRGEIASVSSTSAGQPFHGPLGAAFYTLGVERPNETVLRYPYVEMGGAAVETASSKTAYFHGGDFAGGAAIWMWFPRFSEKAGREDLGVAIACNTGHKASTQVNTYAHPSGVDVTVEFPPLWDYAMEIMEAYDSDADALALEPLPFKSASIADGATWSFDLRLDHAHTTAPKGAFVPLDPVKPLELSLTRRGRTTRAAWTHRGRTTAAGTGVTRSGVRTTKTDLSLQTGQGTLDLEDVTFLGSFNGEDMLVGKLSARVDTRDASSFTKSAALCRSAADLGGSCVPCDDRAKACVDVTWSVVAKGEN